MIDMGGVEDPPPPGELIPSSSDPLLLLVLQERHDLFKKKHTHNTTQHKFAIFFSPYIHTCKLCFPETRVSKKRMATGNVTVVHVKAERISDSPHSLLDPVGEDVPDLDGEVVPVQAVHLVDRRPGEALHLRPQRHGWSTYLGLPDITDITDGFN